MSAKDLREIRKIVEDDDASIATTIAKLKRFRTRPSMTETDLRELNFVIGDLGGQAF